MFNLPEFDEMLTLENNGNVYSNILKNAREKGGSTLRIYEPSSVFPSISLTGTHCSLSCAYCNKQFLHHMVPAMTPEELKKVIDDAVKNGALGCLISGGYNKDGIVPVSPFLDVMSEIREKTGVIINLHPGLVNREQAEEIAAAGIDVVSYDIIGSEKIIREVIGLEKTTDDYLNSLANLVDANLEVVPHIGIGFYKGTTEGVKNSIIACLEHQIETLVFLVFWPKTNTAMERIKPPSNEIIQKIIAWTVLKSSFNQVSLGCMRPRDPELDIAAIKAGINRIELPRKQAIRAAESMGLELVRLPSCCALPTRLEEKYLARVKV
ncbi:MAG: radical SAM protein [Candidatus Hodarchaeales archaeon]